jgi:hypothetical protein
MQSFDLPIAKAIQTENGDPEKGGKGNYPCIDIRIQAPVWLEHQGGEV